MGQTFEQFWRELTGVVPQLDAKSAQKFVNRARVDIYESSHWSFLTARTITHIPASISTGTVSVTAYSSNIVFDADAIAVLDAIGMNDPVTSRQIQISGGAPYAILSYETGTGQAVITPVFPSTDTSVVAAVAATGAITGHIQPIDGTGIFLGSEVFVWVNVVVNPTDVQIGGNLAASMQNMNDVINLTTSTALCTATINSNVITLTANDGGVAGNSITLSSSDASFASVTAFSGGVNAGVNPGYIGDTDASASFVIAKRYYPPPSTDFLRWISVINQTVPYQFWTGIPTKVIDFCDPKRMIVGNPYAITQFAAGTDPAGSGQEVPLYELWPTPAYDTVMVQIYQKRASEFSSNTDTLPNAIPDDLLMERAKYRAYEWAAANVGRLPELKGTNWAALMQMSAAEYKNDLWKYKKQDRETFSNASIMRNNIALYPAPLWDSNYMQLSSLGADIVTGNWGWPI